MSHLGPSLRRSARRTRRTSRAWRRAAIALALSLLVNTIVLLEVGRGWRASPRRPTPSREVVLAPLTAQEWAANRSVDRSQPAPPLPPPIATPPAPPPRDMPGQVVDVAPSKNDAPPKDSRFVSERNNTVEKQTRSRDARAGFENTLPKPSSPKSPASAPPERPPPAVAGSPPKPSPPRGQGPAGGATASERPSALGHVARERLSLAPKGELRNPMRAAPSAPRGGVGANGEAEKGDGRPRSDSDGAPGTPGPLAQLDLRPSASAYDRLAGGPAPDRLDGVEEGDGTYLNTREWKYSGYFNRIKQAIASQWDPTVSMAARDPTGARFSHKDWETLVMVRLDSAGALKRVTVARGSGLDFLDRIAVEAFEKAQPFANPPPGLADERGEIVFSFGFYVQTGGSGMRVFRSQR